MGINYNAKIASSGLVLHLDAGNARSGTNLNRNLYSYPEDFTNSFWNKNSTVFVTANQAIAPDGTLTADLVTATGQYPWIAGGAGAGSTYWPVNVGEYYTISCYVKYVNQQYCCIVNEIGVPNLTVRFDLINGTATGSSYAYGITSAGNGWYRIYATYVIPATYTAWNPQPIRIGQYDGTNYTGSQMYAWGAQLEMGATPSTYYPVSNAVVPTQLNDLSGYDNHANLAPYALTSVEVLVVAGGGGGGPDVGGGGGAGGVVYNRQYAVLPNTTYTVVVGAGGTGGNAVPTLATNGANSQFDTIVAIGGGAGGSYSSMPGQVGGSGGGGSGQPVSMYPGPGVAGQGYSGGNGSLGSYAAGGGGGAGGPGTSGFSNGPGGAGGVGVAYDISGTLTYYGGGGGGGGGNGIVDGRGFGGLGGGGIGSSRTTAFGSTLTAAERNGQANTGGGGGGTGGWNTAGDGGSGIVIIRYKGRQRATGGTVTTVGDYTIHTYTSTGSTTFVTNSSNLPAYSPTYGGVLQLNGTNNLLMIENSASLSLTNNLTLSCWYYANAAHSGMGLITKGPEQSDYDFMVYLTSSSLNISMYKKTPDGTAASTGGATVALRTWTYAVITLQNDGTYYQYTNGVLVNSGTITSANSNIRISNNPMRIGRGWSGGYFQGYIGPTHIYNRALSASEVLGNFNAMRGRFGV